MRPTVASIIAETAAVFEITPEQITAPSRVKGSRQRRFARPRQVAMVLARQMVTKPGKTDKDKRTPISLPALARVFGHRDHTTVICAMRSIPKLSENDSELAAKIKQIRDSLEVA